MSNVFTFLQAVLDNFSTIQVLLDAIKQGLSADRIETVLVSEVKAFLREASDVEVRADLAYDEAHKGQT